MYPSKHILYSCLWFILVSSWSSKLDASSHILSFLCLTSCLAEEDSTVL